MLGRLAVSVAGLSPARCYGLLAPVSGAVTARWAKRSLFLRHNICTGQKERSPALFSLTAHVNRRPLSSELDGNKASVGSSAEDGAPPTSQGEEHVAAAFDDHNYDDFGDDDDDFDDGFSASEFDSENGSLPPPPRPAQRRQDLGEMAQQKSGTIWGTFSGDKYDLPENFTDLTELSGHPNVTLHLTGSPIERSMLFVPIEDIVREISRLKGDDICVMQVDEARADYGDFVVVATGKSPRHMTAMALDVAALCNDTLNLHRARVRIEGLRDEFWTVLHTGNIVIHFMMPAARRYYDLEALWRPGGGEAEARRWEEEEGWR